MEIYRKRISEVSRHVKNKVRCGKILQLFDRVKKFENS